MVENKDILFIINPNSGRKQAFKYITEIDLLNQNWSYVITNSFDEFEDAFKLNIEKYKVFIVIGGDGTVNNAVKFLQNRNDKILGILPAGSGNGFAKELGFNNSLESLMKDIKKGDTTKIDILSVNDEMCINVAGIGFDSFVAHYFHDYDIRGFEKYIYAALKAGLFFKPFNATITVDEKIINDDFFMIAIANTRQFGNNVYIAPMAKPDDGIFELIMVKPLPPLLYPTFIQRLFSGTITDSKYVEHIQVRNNVKIESTYNKYHIDGEPRIFNDNLNVKMINNKIRVVKTSNVRKKFDFLSFKLNN